MLRRYVCERSVWLAAHELNAPRLVAPKVHRFVPYALLCGLQLAGADDFVKQVTTIEKR